MDLSIFKGNELEVTLPDGNKVTIREQSATDDEILSSVKRNSKDTDLLGNYNRFLAAQITKNHQTNRAITTAEEVEGWKLKNKYYLLLKTRIHSLGTELLFTHECSNPDCRKETEYKEDLAQYDQDLSDPLTDDLLAEAHKHVITPYPTQDDHRIITLSSGLKIRYEYMTGVGELKSLRLMENGESHINVMIYVRNPEVWDKTSESWIKVTNLNFMSKRDANELRNDIQKHDRQFEALIDVECPHCGNKEELPFITIKDFFFPSEA